VSKETFRDALFGWLTIVAKNASEASFRYSERQTWVKDGDAAHSSMRSETLLLAQWVEAYIDSMRKVPEWTEVVEEALTWHELAEHIATNCGCVGHYGTIYADLGLLLQSFLPPIRFNSESKQTGTGLSLLWFDTEFARFASFIECPSMAFRYTTVIAGLIVPDEMLPLTLGDDVVLERLSPDMTEMFGSFGMIRGPMFMGRPGPYENPNQPWLSLRWSRSFPKLKRTADNASHADFIGEDNNDTDNIRDAFLGALALTRFGVVFLGSTAQTQEDWSIGGFTFTLTNRTPDMRSTEGAMTLDFEDLLMARTLFEKLRALKKSDDKIGIATRRLAFAMENTRDEDRLLDGMIAAEAVLDTDTEIKYKFALRAAYLLEPTDEKERRAIFDDLTHAYNVRSKLSHGAKANPGDLKISGVKVTLAEFVKRIEDKIRRVVRSVVLSGNVPDWNELIIGKKSETTK
jgi:hypothetical protein